MDNYNISIRNGLHRVKVTLQQWNYKGHIWYNMGGNCFGKIVMDFNFESECGDFENDCQFVFYEDKEFFKAILKDDEGNECKVEGYASEFNDMIVAIEILEYREDDMTIN